MLFFFGLFCGGDLFSIITIILSRSWEIFICVCCDLLLGGDRPQEIKVISVVLDFLWKKLLFWSYPEIHSFLIFTVICKSFFYCLSICCRKCRVLQCLSFLVVLHHSKILLLTSQGEWRAQKLSFKSFFSSINLHSNLLRLTPTSLVTLNCFISVYLGY